MSYNKKVSPVALALAIVLLSIWAEHSQALSCNCGAAPCENPTCCPSGNELVSDACGCCKICAKAQDEECGGPWGIGGSCGNGLSCLRQCECKTVKGQDCVFPFKYKGKSFDKCTTEGSENGLPWCAVTLGVSGEVIEGQWADCTEGCPGTAFTCGETDLFNSIGRCVPTERGEIEANKQLPYKLEEWTGIIDIIPQCQTFPASNQPECTCTSNLSSVPQEGEGCRESGRGLPGWCFLVNVPDPSNPTKGCYEDAIWSPANGRFWSSLACDSGDHHVVQSFQEPAGGPPSPPPPPPPSERK